MRIPRQSKLQEEILRLLEDKGPIKTQQEIAEKLDASQSSISRSIRKLMDEGWVKKSEDGYELVEQGSPISPPLPPNLRSQLASIASIQKEIVNSIQPIYLQRKKLLEQWRSTIKNINLPDLQRVAQQVVAAVPQQYFQALNKSMPVLQKYAEQNRKMTQQLAPYLQAWQSEIEKMKAVIPNILPNIPSIQESIRDWKGEIKKANEKLLPYGWIFTPSMPTNITQMVLKEEDTEKIIDQLVEQYFTDEFCEDLLQNIIQHPLFEKRREALEEAFESHKNGRYHVSIPTFFAQTDGAYIETFGDYEYFYKGKEDHVELSDSSPIEEAMIDGLNELLFEQLAVHSKDLDNKSILNRHVVQHGLWPGYGTKENSIKSILFLDFARFVIEAKEESEEENSRG